MAGVTDSELFLEDLLNEIAEEGRKLAVKACPSRTLRRSMTVIVGPTAHSRRIFVPHYWALYYHEGRGSVKPRKKQWLVFFKNPRLDPRTDGTKNYPVRATQIRRLTKAQFREARSKGQIVVVKSVGPSTPVPFFTRGLRNFAAVVDVIAKMRLDSFVRSIARAESEKKTLRIRL